MVIESLEKVRMGLGLTGAVTEEEEEDEEEVEMTEAFRERATRA